MNIIISIKSIHHLEQIILHGKMDSKYYRSNLYVFFQYVELNTNVIQVQKSIYDVI